MFPGNSQKEGCDGSRRSPNSETEAVTYDPEIRWREGVWEGEVTQTLLTPAASGTETASVILVLLLLCLLFYFIFIFVALTV